MARLNHKLISDIPAEKIISSPQRRFVTDLHLEILENSTLPSVTINQYDDTEIKKSMSEVNSDMEYLVDRVNQLEKMFKYVLDSMSSMSIKYDEKHNITFNKTGCIFTDSLYSSSNVASFIGCSWDNSRKSVK